MRNRFGNILLMAAAAVAFASCAGKHQVRHASIQYVDGILADTLSREYSLISSYNSSDRLGTIAVIGAPEDVLRMAEAFVSADRYNNIDGREGGDGLPDFAGEVIAPVLDLANSPYEDYLILGNENCLKEIAVRDFIFALDTSALVSPFDPGRTVRKAKAKTVVLASTLQSIDGYAEIDTLIRVANPAVEVVSAFDAALQEASQMQGSTIVWTTPERLELGVVRVHAGVPVFSPVADSLREEGSLRGRLLDMLDEYMADGIRSKVGAIVLDDGDISPESLQAAMDDIRSTDDDYLLAYRNLLAPGVRCITPEDAVTRLCHRRMRSRNSFTHRIAWPAIKGYVSVPSASLPEEVCDLDGSMGYSFKYYRAEGTTGDTFTFVEMRDRYLPEALMEKMAAIAPTVYSLYVR